MTEQHRHLAAAHEGYDEAEQLRQRGQWDRGRIAMEQAQWHATMAVAEAAAPKVMNLAGFSSESAAQLAEGIRRHLGVKSPSAALQGAYEPTDAEVEAFKAAWEAQDDAQATPYSGRPGDRTRAGLRAVLTLQGGRRSGGQAPVAAYREHVDIVTRDVFAHYAVGFPNAPAIVHHRGVISINHVREAHGLDPLTTADAR